MVQYIINPWRYRRDLLNIRQEFYPLSPSHPTDLEKKKHAIGLVSVWEQRGNCPHLVASTALLTAAMINDRDGVEGFAVRAAYSVAFTRFVTGLLDGYQDKKYKQSMYSIAKTINLPSTFVELRHQATHEDFPSLYKLRTAAKRAMQWIWDFYWRHLGDEISEERDERGDGDGDAEIHDLDRLREEMRLEKRELVSESGTDSVIDESPVRDLDSLRREMMMVEEEIESGDEVEEDSKMDLGDGDGDGEDRGCGWETWKGPWVPKPIGIV